ncbi:MAG: N-acetylmuramoyl-L-alanine amidase [Nitrospirae bacterium]|nr:N-acetylmuramoyl-L-alanine amidase [Nitrospirota bacterium]
MRIAIDLSGPVEFSKATLSNPERLFFDLKNAKLQKGLQPNYQINDRLVKSIRLGQNTATTVRIVFDLESSEYEFKVLNLDDPPRLVIDILHKGSKIQPKPDKEKVKEREPAPEREKEKRVPDKTEARPAYKRIVLDPGHGGHDPGAVGPKGLYEKDVVLDVALKTREKMKMDHPEYEIILTREKDIFIPLRERAEIANKSSADLFISIHANASPNRQARGIETYLLNWTDDAEALRVAARENDISVKEMKKAQGELGVILTALERESKRDESVKVAGYVQNSLVANITSEYPEVSNHGVKQALFYVLVGAKMPSALVEVSFISNRDEEKLLTTGEYRERLANSIASGINSYFSTATPHTLVSYKTPYRNGYDIKPAKETKLTKKNSKVKKASSAAKKGKKKKSKSDLQNSRRI